MSLGEVAQGVHVVRVALQPRERVFVPLCGKTLDLLWLAELDVLAENERFRQRGLTRLLERVYALRPL